MSRRSSTETIGPWAERHDPQRPVEVALAEGGDLVVEEGERDRGGRLDRAALRHAVQSMMTLPESPDRAAANAASYSRNPNRWVIAGRDVEPRLEHDRHLVPGLVHLAAVDAPQRQHLEDDRVDVERDLLGRDAEDRDPAAVGHRADRARGAPSGCPTSRARRRSPRPCRARRRSDSSVRSRGSIGERRAHPHRQLAPEGVRLADDDVARAGVAGDGRRHQPDRAGAARPGRPRRGPGRRARCGPRCRTGRRSRRPPRRSPGQWCQTLVIGRTTYSANAPSRPTPRPIVLAHRWRRPARQWRQRPQTTWPSPETRSPGWKSATLRADLDDLADELVADDERRLDRPGRPRDPTTRCGGPCRRSRSCGPGSGRR